MLFANFAKAQNQTDTIQMTPQQWVEWMNTLPSEQILEEMTIMTQEQADVAGDDLLVLWTEKISQYELDKTRQQRTNNNETIQGNNETIQGNNEIIKEKNETIAKQKQELESYFNGTNPNVQALLQKAKTLASLTSVDEVWDKYGETLQEFNITKQDLEQN